jgi:hypothetical protein
VTCACGRPASHTVELWICGVERAKVAVCRGHLGAIATVERPIATARPSRLCPDWRSSTGYTCPVCEQPAGVDGCETCDAK